MNIKILRVQELNSGQLTALGVHVRKAIHAQKSDWVCQQLQQPHFWSDEYLQEIAKDPLKYRVRIWVAVVQGKPVAVNWISDGMSDRSHVMFLVDEAFSLEDQQEVADTIALVSIEDMLTDECPGKRNILGFFPDNTPAAAYAKLCGYRMSAIGTSHIPVEKPLMRWEVGMEELRDNILKRREHGNL